jgi:hypothetical protein
MSCKHDLAPLSKTVATTAEGRRYKQRAELGTESLKGRATQHHASYKTSLTLQGDKHGALHTIIQALTG